jgi:hypothetical protein
MQMLSARRRTRPPFAERKQVRLEMGGLRGLAHLQDV